MRAERGGLSGGGGKIGWEGLEHIKNRLLFIRWLSGAFDFFLDELRFKSPRGLCQGDVVVHYIRKQRGAENNLMSPLPHPSLYGAPTVESTLLISVPRGSLEHRGVF